MGGTVHAHIEYVERLLDKGGPEPGDYADLTRGSSTSLACGRLATWLRLSGTV